MGLKLELSWCDKKYNTSFEKINQHVCYHWHNKMFHTMKFYYVILKNNYAHVIFTYSCSFFFLRRNIFQFSWFSCFDTSFVNSPLCNIRGHGILLLGCFMHLTQSFVLKALDSPQRETKLKLNYMTWTLLPIQWISLLR